MAKVLRVITAEDGTTTKEVVNYPASDLSIEISGLDGSIVFYYINEETAPDYDSNIQYLVASYELTTDYSEDYPNLLIANKTYIATYYDNDTIITALNNNLGEFLDDNYPVWQRNKHLWELNNDSDITDDRKTYIESLFSWLETCRGARDAAETALTENGTYPTFDSWDSMPTE